MLFLIGVAAHLYPDVTDVDGRANQTGIGGLFEQSGEQFRVETCRILYEYQRGARQGG